MNFVVVKAQTPERMAEKLEKLSTDRQIETVSLAMWQPYGAVAIVGIEEQDDRGTSIDSGSSQERDGEGVDSIRGRESESSDPDDYG
jgi:hypothetical protein